mgnify:CR=1 FL=1
MCHHAVVEFSCNADEAFRATKLLHYLPEAISAHSIKGLREVNKCHHQGHIVFLSFLLYLSGSKDHVGSTAIFAEATLGLLEGSRFQGG